MSLRTVTKDALDVERSQRERFEIMNHNSTKIMSGKRVGIVDLRVEGSCGFPARSF